MQRDNPIVKCKNPNLKNCKKNTPKRELVKIRTNEIVILQDIGLEVDPVWVVPLGHTHSRVTWPKIWFQDLKRNFLGRSKVASWPVLFFSSWKSAQPTASAITTWVHRETMKRGWWVVGGEQTIRIKVGCFVQQPGPKAKWCHKFHNLIITATAIVVGEKSCLKRHNLNWTKKTEGWGWGWDFGAEVRVIWNL